MHVTAPASRILGTVLLPNGVLEQALVHIADSRIEGIDTKPSPSAERAFRRDAGGIVLGSREVLAPAFIDVHCHGAGGGAGSEGASSLGVMASTLLAHGVGGFLAAMMTAPLPDLLATARQAGHRIARQTVARQMRGRWAQPTSTLLGVHFEGPALSPIRSAGHDPTALLSPVKLSDSLADAPEAWGEVRIVTVAPELDGGLELVASLSKAGIVASVGHTDASFDVATAAYEAGARSTTHLFNGMPPLDHRAPGPVGAALASAPFVELICDGVHVDSRLLPSIARAVGDDRLVLVSDAVPLAGSRLRSVDTLGSTSRIQAGRAVHPDGTLAGSRLLLDGMVAGAVRSGIPLEVTLRAATENPARLLGLRDRGTIRTGAIVDLVVVSRSGRLRNVLVAARV